MRLILGLMSSSQVLVLNLTYRGCQRQYHQILRIGLSCFRAAAFVSLRFCHHIFIIIILSLSSRL
jgi:chromate transport protein ChrA